MSEHESWEYTLCIPNDPRAVTVCRRTLRLILTLHGPTGLVDTAELLAAELVSNAVRHTEGPAALRVRRSPQGLVWIGAWDTDPAPPPPPRPLEQCADTEEGRGLGLVTACAEYWGWQPSARFGDRGKFVWCELVAAQLADHVVRKGELMVGSSHEALHRIFQKDPALLTRALQQVLHVPFPEPGKSPR